MDNPLITRVAIGSAVVLLVAVVAKYFLSRKSKPPVFLQDSSIKYPVKLVDKEVLTHNVRRFKFLLPTKDHVLGLPTGQHIYFSAQVNNELVVRPYTPTTNDDEHKGYFELVMKIYQKTERFPDGGKLTMYMDTLKVGDYMDVRGPSGLLVYQGRGSFAIRSNKKSAPVERRVRKLGMIAGGTGITPMLQLASHVFRDPRDTTELWLLFANLSEDDIILREYWDDLAKKYPQRFHLWYTVDKAEPNSGWRYSEGFVSEKMISEHMPAPGPEVLMVFCGPPPMQKYAVAPNLAKLGYTSDMIFNY